MFNFMFDNKIMLIIIAIIIITNVASLLGDPSALMSIVISIPGVLIAMTFHEFAHAYAAYKLGDTTAKEEGRLSLNPFDHLDPVGTFMLLFAGFGWGKPVHVNPTNYTRKMSMEKGEAIVSVAGPLMNIVLAFVFSIIYMLITKFQYTVGFWLTNVGQIIKLIVFYTISINVGLGVFNLIPLPPLDGSKVILPFLPYNIKRFFIEKEQLLYFIFVIIFITPIASMIISPAINWVGNGILDLASKIIL